MSPSDGRPLLSEGGGRGLEDDGTSLVRLYEEGGARRSELSADSNNVDILMRGRMPSFFVVRVTNDDTR